MAIYQAMRANLDVMRSAWRRPARLIADVIDRTVTAVGSRMMAQRLSAPLTDPGQSLRGSMRWLAFCC